MLLVHPNPVVRAERLGKGVQPAVLLMYPVWYPDPVVRAGRLGKGAQPAVLLDGRQLGPVCLLAPLLPPRPLAPRAPADASDAARALFLQPQVRGMWSSCAAGA